MENIWNFIADIFSSSITLYIINALLIITVIFNERKSPLGHTGMDNDTDFCACGGLHLLSGVQPESFEKQDK